MDCLEEVTLAPGFDDWLEGVQQAESEGESSECGVAVGNKRRNG